MASKKYSRKELDILKEVGNICAGNASIALGQILFKKIDLETPVVQILNIHELAKVVNNDEHTIVAIHMETLGAVSGHVLLLFSEKSAYNLMQILVGKTFQKTRFITQIGISSLKEIGNIVISSYLSTLSSVSRLAVFPSCPQFMEGLPSSVFKSIFGALQQHKDASLILIETIFTERVTSVAGKFFIAFDSESMKNILKACEKQLKK